MIRRMGKPDHAVTLSPAQIEELNQKLCDARHDVNNYLALIIAATELIRRKPDTTARMVDSIAEQPQRIMEQLQKFSREFEKSMGLSGE
jgi:hypothetical protein